MIEAVKARIKMDENLTDMQRRKDNVDKTWSLLRSANNAVINNASDEGSVALGGWLTLIKACLLYTSGPVGGLLVNYGLLILCLIAVVWWERHFLKKAKAKIATANPQACGC